MAFNMNFNMNAARLGRWKVRTRVAMPYIKSTVAAAALLNSTYDYRYQDKVQTALEGVSNAVVGVESILGVLKLKARL